MEYVQLGYNDIINLTRVIQVEAGPNASPEHMAAMAGVILNRVAHFAWPDTVQGVLNPNQFASIPSGGLGDMPYPTNEQLQETAAAIRILMETPQYQQATYNANPDLDGANYFGGTRNDLFRIDDVDGNHVFVGPRRFNGALGDVPDYMVSYDQQALELINSLRQGGVYQQIMDNRQSNAEIEYYAGIEDIQHIMASHDVSFNTTDYQPFSDIASENLQLPQEVAQSHDRALS